MENSEGKADVWKKSFRESCMDCFKAKLKPLVGWKKSLGRISRLWSGAALCINCKVKGKAMEIDL